MQPRGDFSSEFLHLVYPPYASNNQISSAILSVLKVAIHYTTEQYSRKRIRRNVEMLFKANLKTVKFDHGTAQDS